MKSRTSFCNKTLLKKDLTRFAPLWGLYQVALFMGMLLLLDSGTEYWFAANLAGCIQFMPVVNLCYGIVAAQLLFGDLYNSRMCNAIHAFPVKRETQFGTHILSGLLFSLIPTAVFTAASMPLAMLSNVTDDWQLPLFWFAGTNLQYVFFFALGVFSVLCSGNRVGGGLVYGIVNFLSYIVYFLVDTVYTPLYRGVITPVDVFEVFCPVVRLGSTEFVELQRYKGVEKVWYADFTVPSEGWVYLAVLTVLSVMLVALALWLYKKRHLERAGDLMATPILEPVFMVLYSLVAAAAFQGTNQLFTGQDESMYIFLMAGLAVGWFTGRMLVERQVRVITNWKNCLGFLALALTLAASLAVAVLDPLGIEAWTPEVEDVQSVQLSTGYRGELTLTKSGEMADVIRIHGLILETQEAETQEAAGQIIMAGETITAAEPMPMDWKDYPQSIYLTIRYKLKTGFSVERQYQFYTNTEAGQLLRGYLSSIPAVFSNFSYIRDADDLRNQADNAGYFEVNGHTVDDAYMTRAAIQELLECVIADCEAGTFVQHTAFHPEPVLTFGSEEYGPQYLRYYSVDISLTNEKGSLNFAVYADSENTLAWLEKTGVTQKIRETREAEMNTVYYG